MFMTNKIYYIYKITNNINGKIYIGKHMHHVQNKDTYFGSGVILKQAILKYNKENFTKEIIEYCDKENVAKREIYWIEYYNSFTPNGYNIAKGGNGGNSTNNTHIYTNGIVQKFLKESDEILEGFIKGALKYPDETKRLLSIKLKGNNKNQIPWNKGLHKDNNKVLENAKKAKNTIISSKILKGALNPRAKKFIFISPTNQIIEVIGNIKEFCTKNNFSYNTVKTFKDRGKIPTPKINISQARNNLIGWEVKTVSYDSVTEAKKARLEHRLKLKEANLLTKRQQTISKFNIGDK